MELTVGDTTDKDKEMKDMKKTFKEHAEEASPKEEKKKAPISLEALLSPNKKQEEDKKGSLFEILGGETEEIDETTDSNTVEIETGTANEASEIEAPLEEISEAEKTEVAQEYIDITAAEVTEELTAAAPDTVEEAEALASQAFLEELQNKVTNSEVLDDEVIEDAGDQALEALNIDNPTTEQDQNTQEEVEVNEAELETAEIEDDELEDSNDQQVPTPVVAPTPVPTPVATGTAGATSASRMPSGSSSGTSSSSGSGSRPITGGISSANTRVGPNTLNPNSIDKRRDAKNLLIGALVGYMIGRRRGRIKTENRLMPIQHKLEKQIGDLHEKLTAQELKVRKLAAMNFEQNQLRSLKNYEKDQESKKKQLDGSTTQEAISMPSEKINRVDESLASYESKTGGFERVPSPKSVETMTMPLLLSLADNILIGDKSLRSMYEQGRFDQVELRQLVKDSLNGEKIDKKVLEILAGQEVLSQQKLERQKDSAKGLGSDTQDQQDRVLTGLGSSSLSSPVVDIPNSPVIQSILDSQQQSIEPKRAPTTLLVILAVVTGIIIIVVAGLISS